MTQNIDVLNTAQALATHAGNRQVVVARNIANADTPGFKVRDLTAFSDTYSAASDFSQRTTRLGHIAADGQTAVNSAHIIGGTGPSAPNGNSVSLEQEMTKAVEVKHQYDMALGIFRKSMDILRISLGK